VDRPLAHHRPLAGGAYAIDVGAGGGQLRGGKPMLYCLQAAEKGYAHFRLRAQFRRPRLLPVPQDTIYQLAEALARVREVHFAVALNPCGPRGTTRSIRPAATARRWASVRPALVFARRTKQVRATGPVAGIGRDRRRTAVGERQAQGFVPAVSLAQPVCAPPLQGAERRCRQGMRPANIRTASPVS